MCYPTAMQTGNRRNQRLPELYHNLITLPGKKTPTENTRTESSFQEVRKNVKIYLLKTSGCQSFSILLGVGVEWGWGSFAMELEFQFNILVSQSSYVVPSVRPHGQKGQFYYAFPTTMWTHLTQNKDLLSQYISFNICTPWDAICDNTSTATCFGTQVSSSWSHNNSV